ncbi:terpene synthase family protein [Streptacidiphilus neutrinimicus]|uniref:terpene synthase family protein n=1 Tax=Streptacidiphilus neutrinimicus TaxID=105420 RepID=UPI0005A96C8C|nr:terpene synthase family protein [Streptacidiphilus neutrinimicus]
MSRAATSPRQRDGQAVVLDLALPHGRLRAAWTHPEADTIRTAHDAWFREALTGLRLPGAERLFGECEGVSLMCAVLPQADGERLVGICVAASALFLLDDVADDEAGERARAADYLAVLRGEGPVPAGSAPLGLLARTLTRVREGVPDRLWARFVAGFSEVIAAGAGKERTAREALRNYDAYLAARYADSAFDLVGVAVEHGLGLDMTDTQKAAAPGLWTELHRACFVHTILVNDLLSFRKEYFAGEPMNALAVLRDAEGHSLQQAADTVCARIAAAEENFLAAASGLRRDADDPALERYLTAWELMLVGNLSWSLGCSRYHGAVQSPSAGSTTAATAAMAATPRTFPTRMTLHRDRTVFD